MCWIGYSQLQAIDPQMATSIDIFKCIPAGSIALTWYQFSPLHQTSPSVIISGLQGISPKRVGHDPRLVRQKERGKYDGSQAIYRNTYL